MIGPKQNALMHKFQKVNLMTNSQLLSRLGKQEPTAFSDDGGSVLDANKTHQLSDLLNNNNNFENESTE